MIQRNWGTEITEKPQKIVYTTNKKKTIKKIQSTHSFIPATYHGSLQNKDFIRKWYSYGTESCSNLKKKSREASKTSMVKITNLQDQ